VPKDRVNPPSIMISGTDINHIKNVLRKTVGDEIICFDGSGMEYITNISNIEKDAIELHIIYSKQSENEPKTKISLAQGLPKSSKMDDIVKKSTELGVYEIFPVTTERSIPKADKCDRWQKIAKEASKQCGRSVVPKVNIIQTLDDFLLICSQYQLKILPWEGETQNKLKKELQKHEIQNSIVVLIGPEGGFSAEEVGKAKKYGFITVSLGKLILRTETAGPSVISNIMYELE
jgi:16S rRNA (uracil1498-N3)-methyltransferase